MTKFLLSAIVAMALATGAARAVSTINLDFNGGAGGVADTGFDGVYNLDPTGFTLSGGKLAIRTQPGDIWGRYENDPDDAKNVFYSNLDADPTGGTVVDTKVTMTNINQNFHGGGIWLGTDEDHYIRLGVINNSFEGGVAVEALRENEDLWPNEGGPGNDIDGKAQGIAPSPLTSPLDVWLRLVREGDKAKAYYSLDGGTYNWVRDYTFDAIATGPGVYAHVEGPFKVGVYAFGGPDAPTNQATAAFDYLTARAVPGAIPEPGTVFLLLSGAPMALAALRRRTR